MSPRKTRKTRNCTFRNFLTGGGGKRRENGESSLIMAVSGVQPTSEERPNPSDSRGKHASPASGNCGKCSLSLCGGFSSLPPCGGGPSGPLPPCGGGLGWGVRRGQRLPVVPPHPNPPPQ